MEYDGLEENEFFVDESTLELLARVLMDAGFEPEFVEVDLQLCREFLSSKLGTICTFNTLLEEFSNNLLLREVNAACWQGVKEGDLEMYMDEDGNCSFGLSEEQKEDK